jgi:hypothetical protein
MAKTLRRSSERLLKITSESRDPRIRKTLSYFAAKQEQLDVA